MTSYKHPRRKKQAHIDSDFKDNLSYASRQRCLEATQYGGKATAEWFNSLIEGEGFIKPDDTWTPRGKDNSAQARLDETPGFIKNPDIKKALHDWWIAPQTGTRTPAWDIASSCTIGVQRGLLLIEAKAHISELNSESIHSRDKENLKQIKAAFDEASEGWNSALQQYAKDHGFKLSHSVHLTTSAHYPLCCQFAFAWKLASLGIPVILMYLGFLDAFEIEEEDNRLIFTSPEMWDLCVFEKTSKPLPEEIWDATFDINGTPLTVIRRTATIDLPEAPPSRILHKNM